MTGDSAARRTLARFWYDDFSLLPAPSMNAEVLVLGGGYGGLTFARTLHQLLPDCDILLLDRETVHQLVIQLHEGAAFTTPVDRLGIPFERVRNGVRVAQRTVTGFDFAARHVITDQGPVGYRWLVIALGSEVSDAGIPGVGDAFCLRWLEDARRLRAHLETLRSGLAAAAPAEREAWQTIVIGGGGATGVQLAGELADWLRDDWNRPPGGRVVLVEATPTLLPRFPAELGREAARVLRAKGVEIRLDEPITAVAPGVVSLASGARLVTRTMIWAGGIRLPSVVAAAGLPLRQRALATDEFLRVPDLPDVFVIGDCLAVIDPRSGERLPASAQLATQAARAAAENVARARTGRSLRPFRPAYLGEAISLGRDTAVARVGPLTLRGLAGLAVKHFTEQRYIEALGGMSLLREWSDRRRAP
ncbi:MAG: FAD-dependent oxidoreductase [Chloroflexota bacterium]|nr:FAD-dependent oxidoreductase [Dehalococcoidia bacterium]MDW8254299.1 FAD-dependent oxidoreductase [Chloroflexota bacterium]